VRLKISFQGALLFLDGAVKIVHTGLWPHYPNKNVFNDRRNRLCGKSASLRCGGKLVVTTSVIVPAVCALSISVCVCVLELRP